MTIGLVARKVGITQSAIRYRRAGITIRGLASITSQRRGSNVRREVLVGVLQQRIADLDALMIEAQESKRRLEETIACRCDGDPKARQILDTMEDAHG